LILAFTARGTSLRLVTKTHGDQADPHAENHPRDEGAPPSGIADGDQKPGGLAGWIKTVSRRVVRSLTKPWYPKEADFAKLPDATLQSLRAEAGSGVRKSLLSLLAIGTYFLLALNSPDALLLSDEPSIYLPLVGTDVALFSFIIVGPLLLFAVWTFLTIQVRYRRELGRALHARSVAPLPTFTELNHPFLLLSGSFIYWLVPILVLMAFAIKAAAVPGMGVVLAVFCVACLWGQSVAAAGIFLKGSARRKAIVGATGVMVILMVVVMWKPTRWVRPYQIEGADLSGIRLPGQSLRGLQARRANLAGADLRGADLRDADLSEAFLEDADLSKARLSRANLAFARLKGAIIEDARADHVVLRATDLSGANLTSANLAEAQITNSSFQEADLFLANLDGSDISGTDFAGARLEGVRLSRLAFYQPPLPGNRSGLEGGLGLTEEQRGQLRQLQLGRSWDGSGKWLFGGDLEVPPLPIGLDAPLVRPDSNDDSAWKTLREECLAEWQQLLPEALVKEFAAAESDEWLYTPEDAFEPPDYSQGEATEESVAPWSGPPALWNRFLGQVAEIPELADWAQQRVKRPGTRVAVRELALSVLNDLPDAEETSRAFLALADWYANSEAVSVNDADFRERYLRPHLLILALRHPQISDQSALEVIRQVLGQDPTPFLEYVVAHDIPFHSPNAEEQAMIDRSKARAARMLR